MSVLIFLADQPCTSQDTKFQSNINFLYNLNEVTIEPINKSPCVSRGYKCRHCSNTYVDIKDLMQHAQSHGINDYPCPLCNIGFKYLGNLRTHIAKNHPGPHDDITAVRHRCQQCGKTYAHKGDLRVHERRKHPLKSGEFFKCNTCEKTFNTRQALQCHVVKSFACKL
jgi:uncharacterized C2H2 Zn-finger protein